MNRFRIEYRIYTENGIYPFVTAPDSEIAKEIDTLNITASHRKYINYDVFSNVNIGITGDFAKLVFSQLVSPIQSDTDSIECRIFDKEENEYLRGFYYIKTIGVKEWCNDSGCVLEVNLKYESIKTQKVLDTLTDRDTKSGHAGSLYYNFIISASSNLYYCSPQFWYWLIIALQTIFLVIGVSFAILAILALAGIITAPLAVDFAVISAAALILAGILGTQRPNVRNCENGMYAQFIREHLKNLMHSVFNGIYTIDDSVFTTPTLYPLLQNAALMYSQGSIQAVQSEGDYLNWSGEQMFEYIRDTFAAKIRVEGDKLLIRNRIEDFNDIEITLTSTSHVICVSPNGEVPYSYTDAKCTDDPMDKFSREVFPAYNDIIDHNDPPKPTQKGANVKQFRHAPTNNRHNGYHRDPISSQEEIGGVIITSVDDDKMLIEKSITGVFRLVFPDTSVIPNRLIRTNWNTGRENAMEIKGTNVEGTFTYGLIPITKTNYLWNYPAYYDENLHNAGVFNLYTIWQPFDPRTTDIRKNTYSVTLPICAPYTRYFGFYENDTTFHKIDYSIYIGFGNYGSISFLLYVCEIRECNYDFGANVINLKLQPIRKV